MRLKRFNEIVNYHTLLSFINDNLTYLLDNYTLNINDDSIYEVIDGVGVISETYQVWIQPKGDAMKWEDIKLDFIPFFELFINKYDVIDKLTIADGVYNHYDIDNFEESVRNKSLISLIKFDIRK